ncbi:MAG: hypothetical protein WBG42_12395, partial [Cryomorphaceae bacterium]
GLDDYIGLADIPLYEKTCYWDCVGSNYAYRIQQHVLLSNTGMGHYSIQPAYDYYNEEVGMNIPYYMHMAEPEMMQYTNGLEDFESPGWYDDNWIENGLSDPWVPVTSVMLPAFHGMGSTWDPIGELGDYQNTGIFGFYQYTDPLATGGYTSPSGAGLPDEYIFAIKKYSGWWRTGGFRLPEMGSNVFDSEMQIIDDCVNEDLGSMINKMNSSNSNLQHYQDLNGYNNDPDGHFDNGFHPNYLPDFRCDGGFSGSAPGGGIDDNLDCFYSEWYLEWVIDQIEDGDDYAYWSEILGISLDCFDYEPDDGEGGNTGGGVLVDDVHRALEFVAMSKWETTGSTKIFEFIPHRDLFDSTGAYTPQGPQYIEPGLYTLTFKYPDHPAAKIIFENKKRLLNAIPLSSFVQATVFPVPIVDDYSFNIHLTTTARSKFRYKLFDFNGNELHNQVVQVPKDHDNNHLVTISNPMPDGILLHRFIFEDGSSFSITTIK